MQSCNACSAQESMLWILSSTSGSQEAALAAKSMMPCRAMLPAAPATVQSSALRAAQVTTAGEASGKYSLQPQDQELVFMGERCRDEQTLRDYGVCEPWIVQVGKIMRESCCHRSVKVGLPWPQLRHRTLKNWINLQCNLAQDLMQFLQVAGFTVNPEQPGRRLENGVLVPCEG
jgi:hypothetical protein